MCRACQFPEVRFYAPSPRDSQALSAPCCCCLRLARTRCRTGRHSGARESKVARWSNAGEEGLWNTQRPRLHPPRKPAQHRATEPPRATQSNTEQHKLVNSTQGKQTAPGSPRKLTMHSVEALGQTQADPSLSTNLHTDSKSAATTGRAPGFLTRHVARHANAFREAAEQWVEKCSVLHGASSQPAPSQHTWLRNRDPAWRPCHLGVFAPSTECGALPQACP